MLLEHPFLVAEAHEEIAFLDFPEAELDGLRRAILEADTSPQGLDVEQLRQHLGQNGFATAVDAVTCALAAHAKFLSRVPGAAGVRQSWLHVTRMVRQGEPGESADDLTVPEAWERAQAQWEGEAQEGFSENEFPPSRTEGVLPR
jgi:hypothetical protein